VNNRFKTLLLMFAIFLSFCGCSAFASDNVLQAIQIDGVKDSYNIILRSDDVAELKKTVQAPNKMILNLKGIRASKTINTIYNNTSSVDSVVVEPTGEDSVKILVQASNVANAGIHFDTLKTPLGVLGNSTKTSTPEEIVLSGPMTSYKPVYNKSQTTKETGVSTVAVAFKYAKKILKNEKISWMITFGLLGIFILSGLKAIKGNDNEISIGLSQSLKDREIGLYRGMGINSQLSDASAGMSHTAANAGQNITGINYGLKAYQADTRSPYVTSEINRAKPAVAPAPQINLQQAAKTLMQKSITNGSIQNPTQQSAVKTAPTQAKAKTTNIDSIKFLESMTKIYEKNGRSDLAQGLKANMKKAKSTLA